MGISQTLTFCKQTGIVWIANIRTDDAQRMTAFFRQRTGSIVWMKVIALYQFQNPLALFQIDLGTSGKNTGHGRRRDPCLTGYVINRHSFFRVHHFLPVSSLVLVIETLQERR